MGALVVGFSVGLAALAESGESRIGYIENVLETQPVEAPESVIRDAAERAGVLDAIAAQEGGDVVLETGGEALPYHATFMGGERYVIDLYGALNFLTDPETELPDHPHVGRIRTSLYALEPHLVTRVVLDLEGEVTPRLARAEEGLRVSFYENPGDLSPQARLDYELEAAAARAALLAAEVTEPWMRNACQVEQSASQLQEAAAYSRELVREAEELLEELNPADSEEARSLEEFTAALTGHIEKAERLEEDVFEPFWNQARRRREEAQRATETVRRHVAAQRGFLDSFQGAEDVAALHDAVERLKRLCDDLVSEEFAVLEQKRGDAQPESADIHTQAGALIAVLEEEAAETESLLAGWPHTSPEKAGPEEDESVTLALDTQGEAPATGQSPRQVFQQAADEMGDNGYEDRLTALSQDLEAVQSAQVDLAVARPTPLAATEGDLEPMEAEDFDSEQLDPWDQWEMDDAADPEAEPEIDIEVSPEAEDEPDEDEQDEPVEGEEEVEEEPRPSREIPQIPTTEGVHQTMPAPERAEQPDYDPNNDPLHQPVDIDFREMELANVVGLLAQRARVNVVAGTELTGTVTAKLRNVPLQQALEIVLQMNDLGIMEEDGVFRIVPYMEAQAANRVTETVKLEQADASEITSTLDSVVMGDRDAELINFTGNEATNLVLVSGPPRQVARYVELIRELDVSEPSLPTITQAIKLNHLEPEEAMPVVESMLSAEGGNVNVDTRGRHLVVTDIPVVIEQINQLMREIDIPSKQVAIEAMIVDAVLSDASQTGVNWLLDMVRRRTGDNREEALLDANLGNPGAPDLDAGLLEFAVLSSDIDFTGAIAAEVESANAKILANPVVVTVENEAADISISEEYPYQQITQSTTGPPMATTAFKEIGVTLEVTPRVTHQDDIIVNVDAKQSSVSGTSPDGIPIEEKREAASTLRTGDGQTIFIGGLRDVNDRHQINKVPIVGDIPVLNFMFRNADIEKSYTELMIFLTTRVMEDRLPPLTGRQQEWHDQIYEFDRVPDTQRDMLRGIVRPNELREPAWGKPGEREKHQPFYDHDGEEEGNPAAGVEPEEAPETPEPSGSVLIPAD
ncbi:MAG: secretin N-terminal domain-containing protein [Candidatus Hydrogenedentota bacterium]